MKVTQEQLPDSQVGLQIEIPATMTQQTYDKVLRKLMQSANIPGFRRGKVPRQIFLQRVGSTQVKAAALEELVQAAIDQAIAQEKIEALGNYQLISTFEDLISQYQPGQLLVVNASLDVPPRVTLSTYTGLTTQAEEVVYSADRVDQLLEQHRVSRATLVPIEDRPAAMGDTTVVDFAGQIAQEDGTFAPFEGGKAEDFQLDIKPGSFIDGFVEGIVGMTLEQTKEITVTFPADYPQADLAGKPAKFEITLKELKEKELPDLDDEFAQEVSEFETLVELRDSLEERYKSEAHDKTEANQREAILNALVEHLEAELPETLVRREVNHLVSQAAMQLSQQGIDVNKLLTPEIIENMRERSRPDALDRLRRTLALGEVAKKEAIALEDGDVTQRMQEMLAEVKDPQAVDQQRLREVVTEELLQDKILTWLLENNTVELVPEGSLTAEEEGDPEAPSGDQDSDAENEAPAVEDAIDVSASVVEADENKADN
ncbi:MAG: trigger factor [Cyanobacteria bacterium]|nr:trigger factor [Cyanobacteriota bacterium]